MRRGPLVLIAVLPFTTFASAQTPGGQTNLRLFELPAVTTQMSPDSVVARVMSFDRDNDGRVTRDELPDRMHNLLSDATGGAIDSAAIRARAMTVPSARRPSPRRLAAASRVPVAATRSAIRSASQRARTWKERWTI